MSYQYPQFQGYSSPYASPNAYPHAEYVNYLPTPAKQHSRKHNYPEAPYSGHYYSSPGPYAEQYEYYTPPKDAYVSPQSRPSPGYGASPSYSRTTRRPSYSVPHPEGGYTYAEARSKPAQRTSETPKTATPTKHRKKASADGYSYYHQGQGQHEEQPKKTRARASTGTTKPTKTHTKSSATTPPSAVRATDEDRDRAGIPAGYSIKNWDATEKPIILLGSVFDANTLGKWIYDWTVFHHGASSPMADLAGELWLLLIKLAGKTKRGEECLNSIRNNDSHEMVEDFVKSGSRLWDKFKQLLKECEYYMMKAAQKEGSQTMGKNAGTEFVDSIFGRERYLETTEKIMTNIRLWNLRFDVNCEDILRRPGAA